jgi:hypothetical protein
LGKRDLLPCRAWMPGDSVLMGARRRRGPAVRAWEAVLMDRRMRALAALVGAAALLWCGRVARRHSTRPAWLVKRCDQPDAPACPTCSDRPEPSEELEPLLAVAGRAGLDRTDGLRLARATLVTFRVVPATGRADPLPRRIASRRAPPRGVVGAPNLGSARNPHR